MKDKLARIIRIITIAPIMALALLGIIYIFKPFVFGNTVNFILSIVFLFLLPVSAYPLQKVMPHFKEGGRDAQRTLAILMANLGYILGIIVVFITGLNADLLIIYLTYLFSGALVLVINKVIKIKASGHACGVVGPIAALIYFFGMPALFGIIFIIATYWASVYMKRHTGKELTIGSFIPVGALILAILFTQLMVR